MSRLQTSRSPSPQKKVKKAPIPILLAKSPPKETQMQMLRSVEEIFDGKIDSDVIHMILTEKSWIVEEAVEVLSSMIDEEPSKSRPSAVSQLDLIAFSLLDNTSAQDKGNYLPVPEVTGRNPTLQELGSDGNDMDVESISGESTSSFTSSSSSTRGSSSDSAERPSAKNGASLLASISDQIHQNTNGHSKKKSGKSAGMSACKENTNSSSNSSSKNHTLKVTQAKRKPKNTTAKSEKKDSSETFQPVGQSPLGGPTLESTIFASSQENTNQVRNLEASASETKDIIDYSLQSYLSMYGTNFGLPTDLLTNSTDNTLQTPHHHMISKVKVDNAQHEQINSKSRGKNSGHDTCSTHDRHLSDSDPHCEFSRKDDEKTFKDFIIPKTRVEDSFSVDTKTNAVSKEGVQRNLEQEKMFRNSASSMCDNYGDRLVDQDGSIIGVYSEQPQVINPSSQLFPKDAGQMDITNERDIASPLDFTNLQNHSLELSADAPVFYSQIASSYPNSLTGQPFFMMPKSPQFPTRPKGNSPAYNNAYMRPRNQHHLGYIPRQLRPYYAHKTPHFQNTPVPKGQPMNEGLAKNIVRPPAGNNCKRSLPPRQLLDKYCKENKKVLVLLRGLPGSGKSHLAREIVGKGISLSTDEFFVQDGVYRYDPNELSSAHTWNKQRAINAMESGASPVIIDNTNTKIWEMKPYAKAAVQNGYSVIIMEPETSWKFKARELQARNIHGVTKDVINKMKDRYDMNVTVEELLSSLESGSGAINKPKEIRSEDSKPNQEVIEKSFVRPKTTVNSKACDQQQYSKDSLVLKVDAQNHSNDSTDGKLKTDTDVQSCELSKNEILTAECLSQDLALKPDCDSFWSQPEDIKKAPSPKPKRERKQNRHKKAERNPKETVKDEVSSVDLCNNDDQSDTIKDINKDVEGFSDSGNGNLENSKDKSVLNIDKKDSSEDAQEEIDQSFNCSQTIVGGDEQTSKCGGKPDTSVNTHCAKTGSDLLDKDSQRPEKHSLLIDKDLKDRLKSQTWNTFTIEEQTAAVLPVIVSENDCTVSVQTTDVGTYTDGSHLDESKKDYLRIVMAKPRDINKAMPVTVVPKTIHRVAKLDKGCNTENVIDFQPNLEFLRSSFPHLTDQRREEILEMCHNDMEWAIELILDYDTPSFTTGEMEEITSEVFKLKSEGCASKTSSIERADVKSGSSVPPSLFDLCQRVMAQNNIAKEKIEEHLISNGMKRLEKLETHGLQRMRSLSIEEVGGNLTKPQKSKPKNPEYYNSISYFLNEDRLDREGVIKDTDGLQMLQGYDESSSESSEGYVTPNDGSVSPVPSPVKPRQIVRPKQKPSPEHTSMVSAMQSSAATCYSELSPPKEDSSSLPLPTLPTDGIGTELSMKIPGEFVKQLQQLFGQILPEKLNSDEEQEVFLDLKAARQIHRCLKNTVENGSIERKQQLLNDEALARMIQEDEDKKTTKLNRVKKKPQPVNLGDIIQEELNRKFVRERHLKYLESTGDHIAIATKLKRQKLLEKFPGLDEGLFEEMFEANGYSYEDTDAAIKAALGPPMPVKTVLSPEAEEAYYQKLIEEAKQKSLLDILETPAYIQTRHKEYQRVTTDHVDYQELRGEANLHHMLRQNCYVKAQEAFQRGMPEVSSFYAQQGRLHGTKIKEANMRASQKILELRRAEVHDNMTLDLHGFHVDEALSVLNQVIVQKEKENTLRPERKRNTLFVITGRGLNSRGGVAKVRPAIINFLASNNYKYIEEKPGIIKIQLRNR